MPETAAIRAREDREASDESPEIAPFDLLLHLPSSLPTRIPCPQKLRLYEFRLREAQAHEALEELRQHLRLRTHMYKYKDRHIVGQRANTRSQSTINRVQKKVDASAAKYRIARHALTMLSRHVGENAWSTRLLPLAQEDIRPLMAGEEGQSEGRRTLSWIWKVVGISGQSQDEGMEEGTSHTDAVIYLHVLTIYFVKHCELSGAELGREPCAGRKRSFCCVKRCEGH
jgi:hypothetical protein